MEGGGGHPNRPREPPTTPKTPILWAVWAVGRLGAGREGGAGPGGEGIRVKSESELDRWEGSLPAASSLEGKGVKPSWGWEGAPPSSTGWGLGEGDQGGQVPAASSLKVRPLSLDSSKP